MKRFFLMPLTLFFCVSLFGCESYSNSHTKIEKTKSTNIALTNDFESVDSIKKQLDKLAKKHSNKAILGEVFIHAPEGKLKNSTAYFIYYSESKGNATKITYKINVSDKKIVESKVQQGYPDEIGGAIPKAEFDTSVDIQELIDKTIDSDDFEKIKPDNSKPYDIEINFFANEIKVTANESSRVIFEKSVKEQAV